MSITTHEAPPDLWTWRHPEGRLLSAVVGVGALAAATALGGAVTWTFWAGLIGPDLAFLKGWGQPTKGPGHVPEETVGLYNDLHHPIAPAATVALGVVTLNQPLVVGGLGWLAHIAIDRATGIGLRHPDGSIH
jgi:hypothetical protein